MKITASPIEGLLLIQPETHSDSRGYFCETYNSRALSQKKIEYFFVQDNEALSSYGVIRGLHFQTGKFAQSKLVRVISGEVLDVAVDLRPDSPSFGQYFSVILSEHNKLQLLIPQGFAHGYSVLSPTALFLYKCDNYYNKSAEGGIHPLDPSLNIDWKIPEHSRIIADKDLSWPYLRSFNEYI